MNVVDRLAGTKTQDIRESSHGWVGHDVPKDLAQESSLAMLRGDRGIASAGKNNGFARQANLPIRAPKSPHADDTIIMQREIDKGVVEIRITFVFPSQVVGIHREIRTPPMRLKPQDAISVSWLISDNP